MKDKKTAKKYYFISGLPRAGSTLLANILAQNPRFHVTGTSGIMDVIFGVRNAWDNSIIEFKAAPNEPAKKRVMRGILDSFYDDVEKPVVFDKSRGSLSLLEMPETILDSKAKVLVPVRDLRDVLSSFEKLWRVNSKSSQLMVEQSNYFQFQTTQGRAEFWMRADQPVGLAYNRVTDAIQRGFGDRMFLVDFDDMTREPEVTFKKIYEFLGEQNFKHNFKRVEQVTWEDDSVHGFKGLHDIRPNVAPIEPQWPTVLGTFAEQYGRLNFWKK